MMDVALPGWRVKRVTTGAYNEPGLYNKSAASASKICALSYVASSHPRLMLFTCYTAWDGRRAHFFERKGVLGLTS